MFNVPRLADAAQWPPARPAVARRASIAVAVFLAALIARLVAIGAKPFWLDEFTTLRRAALPWVALVRDSLRYHHIPTYFALVRPVLAFGDSEAVLRLPSALAGAAACAVVALCGSRIAGRPAGALAGWLAAVSPIGVQYGQEARSYALVMLCVACSLLGLLRLAAPRPGAPPRDPVGWGLLLGGAWAATNTLSIALAWPVSISLAIIALPKATRRRWWAGLAVIAVLTAPWFIAMHRLGLGAMTDGLTWIPPLDIDRVTETLASVYLMRVSSLIASELLPSTLPGLGVAVMLTAAVLAAAGAWWCGRHRRVLLWVLAATTITLPLGLLAISAVFPLWMPRYLLPGLVPFWVLSGAGVNVLATRHRWPAVVLLAALGVVNLVAYYPAETKPRWDLAARALQDLGRAGDLVLTDDDHLPDMLAVFTRRTEQPPTAQPPTEQRWPVDRWTLDTGAAMAQLAQGGRLWVARGRVGQVPIADITTPPAPLRACQPPALTLHLGAHVVLMRYDRCLADRTASG